MFVNQINFGV